MLIRESQAQLERMLDKARTGEGSDGSLSVGTALKVFASFAAIPASDCDPRGQDADGVLAQFGSVEFRGAREFTVDLTRQFTEAGDDDAPMWQLACTFYWSPSPATEALGSGNLWSFDVPLEQFFASAACLPGWVWALSTREQPTCLTITLDQV